jgi:hypothetical protein
MFAMQKADATPDPDGEEKDFFQRLRREVERQISTYVYRVPAGALGTPLTAEEIRSDLDEMLLCLIDPQWEKVNTCNTPGEARTRRGCDSEVRQVG